MLLVLNIPRHLTCGHVVSSSTLIVLLVVPTELQNSGNHGQNPALRDELSSFILTFKLKSLSHHVHDNDIH